MAKGNNNGGNRRSHSSKPYDISNSFIKRITSGVTNLIPGRTWLSNWLQSSQDEQEQVDESTRHEPEEDTDDRQQNVPTGPSRVSVETQFPQSESRLPNTGKESLNWRPVNEATPGDEVRLTSDNLLHNRVTREDHIVSLSNPRTSSTPLAIASTSASPLTLPSPLSSLATSRNLSRVVVHRKVNGDDRSETSESASGSSIFLARNGSVGRSSITMSSSTKRQRMDDVDSSTGHSQSQRNLLLHRMQNRHSRIMSPAMRKQPGFNVDIFMSPNRLMDSPINQDKSLNSPFYPGPTTFGGASSAYKPQVVSPMNLRKGAFTPKDKTSSKDVHMSSAARHILETLEQWSTPVLDAKRIPLNEDEVSVASTKRQKLLSSPSTSKQGPPKSSLVIPTVTDLMKWKSLEKLQDSVEAARRLTASTVSPQTSKEKQKEYSIRSDAPEKSKRKTGKIKGKKMGERIENEDSMEPVNLPSIALPITTLPTFTNMVFSTSNAQSIVNTESSTTTSTSFNLTPSFSSVKSCNSGATANRISSDDNIEHVSVSKSENKNDPIPFSNFMNVKKSNQAPVTFSSASSNVKVLTSPAESNTRETKASDKNKIRTFSQINMFSNNKTNVSCNKVNPSDKDNVFDKENVKMASVPVKSKDLKPSFTFSLPVVKKANVKHNKMSKFSFSEPIDVMNDKWKNKAVASSESTNTLPVVLPDVAEPVVPKRFTFRSERKTTSLNVQEKDSVFAPKPSSINETVKEEINRNKKRGSSPSTVSNSMWECNKCSRKNNIAVSVCTSCKNKLLVTAESSKTSKTIDHDAQSCMKSSLTEKLKSSKTTWDCKSCLRRNSDLKKDCESCGVKKSETVKKIASTTSDFGDKFKKPLGTWECSSCMCYNSIDALKCISCEVPKSSREIPKLSTATPGFANMFKKPAGSWECSACMVINKSESVKCISCETPKSSGEVATKPSTTSGFGDLFKKPTGSWECSACMVINKIGAVKCISCETPKSSGEATKLSTTSGFGDLFKKPTGSWECSACMVINKSDAVKCISCETPKLSGEAVKPLTTSGFGDLFKKPLGSWECSACMVCNKSDAVKCISCETPKSGVSSAKSMKISIDVPPEASKFKFGIDKASTTGATTSSSTVEFKFGMPTTSSVNSTFTFGIPKSNANPSLSSNTTSHVSNSSITTAKLTEPSLNPKGTILKTGTSTSQPESQISQNKSEEVFKMPANSGDQQKLSQMTKTTPVFSVKDDKQNAYVFDSKDTNTNEDSTSKKNFTFNSKTVSVSNIDSKTSETSSVKQAAAFSFDPSKSIFGNIHNKSSSSSVSENLIKTFGSPIPSFSFSSNTSKNELSKSDKTSFSGIVKPDLLDTEKNKATGSLFSPLVSQSQTSTKPSEATVSIQKNSSFVAPVPNPIKGNNSFALSKSDSENPFAKLCSPFQIVQNQPEGSVATAEKSEIKNLNFGSVGSDKAQTFGTLTTANNPVSFISSTTTSSSSFSVGVKPTGTGLTFDSSQNLPVSSTSEFKPFSQPVVAKTESSPFVFGSGSTNTSSLFSFGDKSTSSEASKSFVFGAQQKVPVLPSFSLNTTTSVATAPTFSFGPASFGSAASSTTQFSNNSATSNVASPFGSASSSTGGNAVLPFGTSPAGTPNTVVTPFGNASSSSLFGAVTPGFGANNPSSFNAISNTTPTAGGFSFPGNQPSHSGGSMTTETFSFGQAQTGVPKFDPDAKPSFKFTQGETTAFTAYADPAGNATASPTPRVIRKAHRRKPLR